MEMGKAALIQDKHRLSISSVLKEIADIGKQAYKLLKDAIIKQN